MSYKCKIDVVDRIRINVEDSFLKNKIIKENDIVIVALSGGKDSMCLLNVLLSLSHIYKFYVYCLHVNHGIRGVEADRDLNFVVKYANDINVKIKTVKVDAVKFAKENGKTEEEACRVLRYKALNEYRYELLHKEKIKRNVYIAVAHHKNDQAETILFNMIRGTGVKGLIGIKKRVDYIIRPLLDFKRSEIDEYIEKMGIPNVLDSTNLDIKYTRNFLRLKIIKDFEAINSNAVDHIVDSMKDLCELYDYIKSVSIYVYERISKEQDEKIYIDNNEFVKLSNLIKVSVIRFVFEKMTNNLKDISRVNIEDIIRFSMKEKGGHLDMPYNITIDKKKNKLIFIKNKINISMKNKKKK